MREKLIKLLNEALNRKDGIAKVVGESFVNKIADHLIANGVTIQNWIPVTERLPESGEWVLCACRANIIEVLKYDRTMDDWDSTMPERCYMKGFVTHWMPLPEPLGRL